MRHREIITTETAGDTWASRFAQTQRKQAKQAKTRKRLATATSKAYQHHRQAVDTAARDHDKITDLQAKLAKPT